MHGLRVAALRLPERVDLFVVRLDESRDGLACAGLRRPFPLGRPDASTCSLPQGCGVAPRQNRVPGAEGSFGTGEVHCSRNGPDAGEAGRPGSVCGPDDGEKRGGGDVSNATASF